MRKETMNTEELLSFAEAAGQPGTSWIRQANYVGEEAIMTDEDLSGREPLQQLRILVEAGEQTKYFESIFYSAAELEELMSELEPVFEKFPKQVLNADEMDDKVNKKTT